MVSSDQNTRRESGRKVQLGNVEAAKVSMKLKLIKTRKYLKNRIIRSLFPAHLYSSYIARKVHHIGLCYSVAECELSASIVIWHVQGLSKQFVLGVSVRQNDSFTYALDLDHLVSIWQPSSTNTVFGLQTIADIIRTCLGPKAMLKVSWVFLTTLCC